MATPAREEGAGEGADPPAPFRTIESSPIPPAPSKAGLASVYPAGAIELDWNSGGCQRAQKEQSCDSDWIEPDAATNNLRGMGYRG
jgi:hypothetical protein